MGVTGWGAPLIMASAAGGGKTVTLVLGTRRPPGGAVGGLLVTGMPMKHR